ncbi:MAG: porin family protein [bacterium]|nr:porin family protein [bacterium]
MKQLCISSILVLTMIVVCPMSSAAEGNWVLRLNGGWLESSAQATGDAGPATFTTNIEGSAAFSIGIEYLIAERFGIELSILHSKVDLVTETRLGEWSAKDSSSLDVTPLTLAFNLHLTPRSKVDLYLSPSISHVRYGDFRYTLEEEGIDEVVDVDNDSAAFGLAVGIDVPLGSSGWNFNAEVGTIWTDADGKDWDGMEGVSVDPTLVLVGFARRF